MPSFPFCWVSILLRVNIKGIFLFSSSGHHPNIVHFRCWVAFGRTSLLNAKKFKGAPFPQRYFFQHKVRLTKVSRATHRFERCARAGLLLVDDSSLFQSNAALGRQRVLEEVIGLPAVPLTILASWLLKWRCSCDVDKAVMAQITVTVASSASGGRGRFALMSLGRPPFSAGQRSLGSPVRLHLCCCRYALIFTAVNALPEQMHIVEVNMLVSKLVTMMDKSDPHQASCLMERDVAAVEATTELDKPS